MVKTLPLTGFAPPPPAGTLSNHRPPKRPRDSSNPPPSSHHHPTNITARKIHSVVFSGYEILSGFPSPYPFDEQAVASTSASTLAPLPPPQKRRVSVSKSKSPELVAGVETAPAAEREAAKAGDEGRKPSHKRVSGLNGVNGFTSGASGSSAGIGPHATVASVTSGGPPETQRLFICDGCFKYMVNPAAHVAHMKACEFKHPPGRKVYQRGAHIIWEVDGAVAKLYAQNLCLFSKLFIEHKYMFFDVEGFMFYVLTDATPSRDYVLGYFSKEKISYDDNNLACIVTYPPYQKKGYGTLLIEFSYELDRRTSPLPHAGSPERPLSSQGQRGFTAFWTATLVRYFRSIFSPPPPSSIAVDTSKSEEEKRKLVVRRARGWDGELPVVTTANGILVSPPAGATIGLPSTTIKLSFAAGASEGEKKDLLLDLDSIAKDVHIRKEDIIFALVDSGLAQWRPKKEDGVAEGQEELFISPELVEEVAKAKGVKPLRVLDLNHVLL